MTEENSRPELEHDSVDASPDPASESPAPGSTPGVNGVVRQAGGSGEPDAGEGAPAQGAEAASPGEVTPEVHSESETAAEVAAEAHADSVAPEAGSPEPVRVPEPAGLESNESGAMGQNDAEPLLPAPAEHDELLPVPTDLDSAGAPPLGDPEQQMWLAGVDPGEFRTSSTTEGAVPGVGPEGPGYAAGVEGGLAVQTVVEEEEDEDREPQRSTLAEWTITIILLLFLTTTLVQAYVIPTGSMEDTLLVGDHLLVDKLAYAPPGGISQYLLPYTEVKRGDIIVFRYPVDISQTFVKRCIGVPGDHIKIVDQQVFVNGERLDEPYTYHKATYSDTYRDNFPTEPNGPLEDGAIEMLETDVVNGEVVVPEGHYFAMGDNRDFSLDSRYWGFVPRENIIGKPLIIYWSYDAPTDQLNSSSISLDHLIDLSRNFFGKTRWNRTFQLIHGYPLD